MIHLPMLLLLTLVTGPQDTVSPEYTQWAKYKPGTSVTMSMTSEVAGQKTETTTKTTLKSVSDAELVIETAMTMLIGDQKIEQPPWERRVPKMLPKIELPKEASTDPKPKIEEGQEELEVLGKKLKCKRIKTTTEVAGSTMVSTVWTCDDVPGNVVKMETTMGGAMESKTRGVVTAFEVK